MKCPKCKSKDIATERRPNGNNVCLTCHHKWPNRKKKEPEADLEEEAIDTITDIIEIFEDPLDTGIE